MAKKRKISDRQLAVLAARTALHRNCLDVTVLDLRGLSSVTDYFVIATSTSDRQARSVADEIRQLAAEGGMRTFGRSGFENGRWILIDFVDVVVHVFDSEYRQYYALEMLWGDARRVKVIAG